MRTEEQKARRKALGRTEKEKAWEKAYKSTPEYKARRKLLRNTPEAKAKAVAYNESKRGREVQKQFRENPKRKVYIKEYHKKPEVKSYMIEYHQKPEVKSKKRERSQTVEQREVQRKWRNTPEAIARRNTREAKEYQKAYKKSEKFKTYSQRPDVIAHNKAARKDRFKTPEGKEWLKNYINKRKKENPAFKMACILRGSLRQALKKGGYRKNGRTAKITGCSFQEFVIYIESKFEDWMTWDNHGKGHGKWNIDHIIPLASAKSKECAEKLCHFTNLQPLWALENILKSDKLDWPPPFSL